jgi:hypothetical protein
MICVDLWAKGISLRYDRYNHDLNLRLFLERCAGKPIMTWRMSTHQAASCVEDGALDFVFIDANHDYEAVAQDLDDWAPKVSDMLAGHDWTEPGVSRAVNERFTDVVLGPDQCWRVCR